MESKSDDADDADDADGDVLANVSTGFHRDIWATANLLVKKPGVERGSELQSFMWLAIPAAANTLLKIATAGATSASRS